MMSKHSRHSDGPARQADTVFPIDVNQCAACGGRLRILVAKGIGIVEVTSD